MAAFFAFLHHLAAFGLAGAVALKKGSVPAVAQGKLRANRSVIHWELAGIVLILLCAALMARGIGHFGG